MIYLDNAATYVGDNQKVIDVFIKANRTFIGNASSTHRLGYLASRELQKAESEILKLLKLNNEYEVIFTSGASEAINHALKGYAHRNKTRGKEIIAFKNEHPAVLNSLKSLEKEGYVIHYVNAKPNGEIVYDEIRQYINQNTIMVVAMSVNNEVGSINNLSFVHEIIKDYPKCVLFSDVTQSIGKIDTPYYLLDMFAFSAHKFGGLIGSGALVKKKKILLNKLIDGGSQQNDERAGTIALPLILSTVEALKIAMNNLVKNYEHVNCLYNRLITSLDDVKDEIQINAINAYPYILSLSLKKKKASVVIEALSNKEIYVSSQSACHAKNDKPSEVVLNMGIDKALALNTIRVSFSHINTIEEVETFINELKGIIKTIR